MSARPVAIAIATLILLLTAATPAQSACCFPDGTCQDLDAFICTLSGGTPEPGLCADGPCDTFGACCLDAITCFDSTSEDCDTFSGTFFEGQVCAKVICKDPTVGACCYTSNQNAFCQELMIEGCMLVDGIYFGDNTTCLDTVCYGACCLDDESCIEVLDPADCTLQDGIYLGDGTKCAPDSCNKGACCFGDGVCLFVVDFVCGQQSGLFLGVESECGLGLCPAGGCCDLDGLCDIQFELDCDRAGGNYQGHETNCPDDCGPILVRDFEKISGARGYQGELTLGRIVAVGDINGDGVGDLMSGHPAFNSFQGGVTIHFMDADGTIASEQFLGSGAGIPGQPDGAAFGHDIAPLGDLDGNGTPDVAVSAPTSLFDPMDPKIWIVLLQPSGIPVGTPSIGDGVGGLTGDIVGKGFGLSIASLGDVDGDGVTDLAVGAPRTDGAKNAVVGAIWILFLNSNGSVKSQSIVDEDTIPGGFDDQFLGRSLAGLGDLDGDGTTELVASSLPLDALGQTSIVSLNPDGSVAAYLPHPAGEFAGDGTTLSSLGDYDDDDVADYILGDRADNAVWLTLLRSNGTIKSQYKISDFDGYFLGDLDLEDDFGAHATSLGDHDGDGTIDIVINALRDDDAGMNSGAHWVLFLEPAPVECTQDIDGDGETGVTDLVEVILAWGPCPAKSACPQDLDGDGEVGVSDLVEVVLGWGSCE